MTGFEAANSKEITISKEIAVDSKEIAVDSKEIAVGSKEITIEAKAAPETPPQKSHLSKAKGISVMALSMMSFGFGFERSEVEARETIPAVVQEIDLAKHQISIPISEVQIPEGCTRVEATPEQRAWSEFQRTLIENTFENREGLKVFDASRFMSPQTQSALGRYVGLRSSRYDMEIVRVNENGYKYAIKKGEDLWYLSESLHFKHITSNGKSFSSTRLVMWKKGHAGEISLEFKTSGTFGRNSRNQRTVSFSRLSNVMRAAENNRRSEEQDATEADLLKVGNEVIGYIGMIDPNRRDSVIWNMRDDIRYFPHLMNSRVDEQGDPLHNYVVANGSEFLEVRSDPYQLLKKHVKSMYAKGVRDFHINIAGHGSESGIQLNGYRLSPQELRQLFSTYRDCSFLLDTCACGGGGIANMMKDYRDPTGEEGRVVVKLQSKPFTYAQSAHIDGRLDSRGVPLGYSSYYYLFWNHFLKEGMDFGDAHVLADKYCQKFCGCDSEIWKSGPDGGTCTR